MNVLELLTEANKVYDALKGGEFVGAWEATIAIQQLAIDALKGIGFKSVPPTPADAEAKKAVLAKLKDCEKECDSLTTKGMVGAGPVGALFDGKVLRKILDALLIIIPLLFDEE